MKKKSSKKKIRPSKKKFFFQKKIHLENVFSFPLKKKSFPW